MTGERVKASPRWLDGDEQRAWRAYIRATNLISRVLDRELRIRHDLISDDYGILAILSEAPERQLRLGELAESMRVPKAHLTYRFQRLEKAGLVERHSCPEDRRGAFARLTTEGVRVLGEAAPDHVDGVRRTLFEHLTPEQIATLADLMEAILAGHDRMRHEQLGCDEG